MIAAVTLVMAVDLARAPIHFEAPVVAAERAWADCMDAKAERLFADGIGPDEILKQTAVGCVERKAEYRMHLDKEFGSRGNEILAVQPDFDVARHVERFETNWLGLIGMRLDAAAGRELGE